MLIKCVYLAFKNKAMLCLPHHIKPTTIKVTLHYNKSGESRDSACRNEKFI